MRQGFVSIFVNFRWIRSYKLVRGCAPNALLIAARCVDKVAILANVQGVHLNSTISFHTVPAKPARVIWWMLSIMDRAVSIQIKTINDLKFVLNSIWENFRQKFEIFSSTAVYLTQLLSQSLCTIQYWSRWEAQAVKYAFCRDICFLTRRSCITNSSLLMLRSQKLKA